MLDSAYSAYFGDLGGLTPHRTLEVSAVFPRADFVVQEDAGHFPWIDDPGEFASLLAPLVS